MTDLFIFRYYEDDGKDRPLDRKGFPLLIYMRSGLLPMITFNPLLLRL